LNVGKSPWLCLQGSNSNINNLNYNFVLEEPRGRSHNGEFYSYGYTDKTFETKLIFSSIICNHIDDIKKVIGPDFLLADPTFWRTTFIPGDIQSFDIYSQVFHQDSVVDNFNIQIFVLLHDVDSSQGPFQWVEKKYHRQAFAQCRNREKIIINDVPVSNLVGQKGDYLILSTGQTLHRDGIPNYGKERLLASIALFPSYTNIGKLFEDH